MSWRATDLPPPGSPPMSMFRSARVTSTRRPSSSVPRWTGFQIDKGATGTESAVIAGHPFAGLGQSGRDGDESDEGLAAVGAHRTAAQGARLVGNRREPGECFQVGETLVAQPVVGRGGDECGAAADARPGGAGQVHDVVLL